jgi:hypothetical protein
LGEGERAVAFAQRLRGLGWIEGRISNRSLPKKISVTDDLPQPQAIDSQEGDRAREPDC